MYLRYVNFLNPKKKKKEEVNKGKSDYLEGTWYVHLTSQKFPQMHYSHGSRTLQVPLVVYLQKDMKSKNYKNGQILECSFGKQATLPRQIN